jgi:iron complex outermembrane recepter protein
MFRGNQMAHQLLVRRNAVSAAVAIALTGGFQMALAQEDGASRVLDEIIVTAAKREVNIQDIAISVTAIGEEAMALGGIDDISRVADLVPGMTWGKSGTEVRIAMRGTRQNNVGTIAEQAVGIFEDGVYVATSTQAFGSYLDVNRIEVLRGPQGTLYGRNTFGGAINVVTNEPEFDKTSGSVSALYGDYNRARIEGVLNLPLSDTFALRFAAMSDTHDGYIENLNDPGTGDDLNDEDIQFIRATAKWAPTDTFDATLRFTYSDRKTNGSAIWGYQQIGGYVDGELLPGHQFAPADASADFDQGPWVVKRNLRSNSDTSSTSTTLTLNWDLESVSLRFIGNQTSFDGQQNYDGDYSDGGDSLNNGFTGWDSGQDTWSTELQLLSNNDSALEWMLGFYYYDQTANWNWQEMVNGAYEVPHWDQQGDYLSDSTGYFGNATYSISPTVRINAGLRYSEDTKTQKDALDWSFFPPVQDFGTGIGGKWNKTLWKAGIEVDFNDNMLGYFTASTGYRAGGINITDPNIPQLFDPEEVTAYEVGLKSTLADGTVVLNLAAYSNQYRDMQAQSFVLQGGNALEFTENGGEVDTQGIEAELRWVPDEHWNISATLALMDAEFGEYNIAKINGLGDLGGRQDLNDPNAPLLSLKGYTPALSPDVTFGLQLGYDIQLAGGSVLTPFVQTSYSSKYSGFDINVPGQYQDAYTRSDIRLMWTSESGKTSVQAFVLNVEEEAVLNRVVIFNPTPTVASLQAHWGDPRTWGVSASFNFE